MARLQQYYQQEVVGRLQQQLGLANVAEVPRFTKVTLNMGVGEAVNDKKIVDKAMQDLMMISGQKPVATMARKSVATFKIRQGQLIGCKVTLRRHRMYEFLDRLINVAIPRIRDFRGLSPRSFDGRGSYNFGIREHSIFTEIDQTKSVQVFGMNVTMVTTARNDAECKALLRQFGMPFRES